MSSQGSEDPLERDRRLLRAWQDGDEEAGLELLKHYHPVFLSFCRKWRISQKADSEDLWQESFVRLYAKLPRLEIQRSFAMIYWYELCDSRKKLAPVDKPASAPDCASNDPSPGASIEFWEIVTRCLQALGDEEALAFILRAFEGRPYKEIARLLGVALGTLYVTFHRAKNSMVPCLERGGIRL